MKRAEFFRTIGAAAAALSLGSLVKADPKPKVKPKLKPKASDLVAIVEDKNGNLAAYLPENFSYTLERVELDAIMPAFSIRARLETDGGTFETSPSYTKNLAGIDTIIRMHYRELVRASEDPRRLYGHLPGAP